MMYRKDFAFRCSSQILPRKGDIVKYRMPRRVQTGRGGKGDNCHKALPTKNNKKKYLKQFKLKELHHLMRLFLKPLATPSKHTSGPLLWWCFSSAIFFERRIFYLIPEVFPCWTSEMSLTVVRSLRSHFKKFLALSFSDKKAAYLEILFTFWH